MTPLSVTSSNECNGCTWEPRFHEAETDLMLAEKEISRQRRQLALKDRQLADALKQDDLLPQIEDIFDYWVSTCHPKSKAKVGAKSTKVIGDRLRERLKGGQETIEEAVAYIKTAIDGAADDAFVNDKGKRFDDIELICRDDTKLRSFYSRRQATLAKLRGSTNLELMLAACGMPVYHAPGEVRFQCPCCCMVWRDWQPFRPLMVKANGFVRCFACGADAKAVAGALTKEHIVRATTEIQEQDEIMRAAA